MASYLVLCLLALLACSVSAVYVELPGGVTKCFLEEVPRDTLIMGKFKLEDANPQMVYGGQQQFSLGVYVQVSDPEGETVLDKVYNPDSKFAFTAQAGGEHTLCFSTNASRWFGPAVRTRLHLDIETGVGAVDYDEIAKVEHLDALEVTVRRLNDRVTAIRREQNYQRGREAVFHATSESTNKRVTMWSVGQLTVLVIIGVWQMRHLKSFFKAKKLV